jgi:hypothetical protein
MGSYSRIVKRTSRRKIFARFSNQSDGTIAFAREISEVERFQKHPYFGYSKQFHILFLRTI